MNRGAKIVIVAVVALFALTGIYYAFSSPKSRTTAAGERDAGTGAPAAGRISDPISPGASVPETLTMGPSTMAPGGQSTPPDAAFARPTGGTNPGTTGLPGAAPGAGAQPGATAANSLATAGPSPTAAAPHSIAPVIAPPVAPGASPTGSGTPRILPPDRTVMAPGATGTPPSINPPSTSPTVAAKPVTAPSAPASTSYTIKAGDTLSTIAGEYYKDTRKWKAIADANPGVDPARLKVGQVIKVPSEGALARQATTVAERASAATSASGSTHTVAKGETLAAIAERYLGTKGAWKRLYEANKGTIGGDPAKLKVGTKLVIPAS
jgi:nucleoid-associated protein YgaU